jgi:hypothetical protein
MVDLFRGLNLFFSAILAGGMTLELLIVIPATRVLAADQILGVFRFVAHRSAFAYALPNGILALVAAIVVLIAGHGYDHAATILRLIGVIVLLSGAAATGGLYVRGLYMETKNLATLSESDSPLLLSRWQRAQLVRTILYVGSLALFVAADVVY